MEPVRLGIRIVYQLGNNVPGRDLRDWSIQRSSRDKASHYEEVHDGRSRRA